MKRFFAIFLVCLASLSARAQDFEPLRGHFEAVADQFAKINESEKGLEEIRKYLDDNHGKLNLIERVLAHQKAEGFRKGIEENRKNVAEIVKKVEESGAAPEAWARYFVRDLVSQHKRISKSLGELEQIPENEEARAQLSREANRLQAQWNALPEEVRKLAEPTKEEQEQEEKSHKVSSTGGKGGRFGFSRR